MGTSTRRWAWVVSVAAVVTLATAGCASSTTSTEPSGGATSTSPSTSASSTSGSSSTAAPAGGTVDLVLMSTPYGDAIGTADGLVLYTWEAEADGTIACVDAECVEKWPPLLADAIGDVPDLDPARVTLVARPDGAEQVAIDGRPLYHMAVDEPGEATCQGTDGWWILNPDGTTNTNDVPRTATTAAFEQPGS